MIVLNPILLWIAYFAFVRGLVTLCYFSEDDADQHTELGENRCLAAEPLDRHC